MVKRVGWLGTALALAVAPQLSCILCDKDICIVDSGYRWCLNMAGAYGKTGAGILENITTDGTNPVQGCVCLNPADNAVLDGDHDKLVDPKPLDPNTAYYTLLDGIRLAATKVCQERAAAQELADDNCFALAMARMEDVNDAQPAMLAKDCELTAGDQEKLCGKASTSGGGVEVSGSSRPGMPTTGDSSPPPSTTGGSSPPSPATTTGA